MKIQNLKVFFSISLGIHLLLFSVASILFSDFRIDQPPILPIPMEVSLLPFIVEEEQPFKKIVKKAKARSPEINVPKEEERAFEIVDKKEANPRRELQHTNHEEKEMSKNERKDVSPPEKEIKPEPVFTPPVQNEAKVVPVDEPKWQPVESKKWETRDKKKPEPVFTPPVRKEAKVAPVDEPRRPPVENKEQETEDKKEPELISPSPVRSEEREVSVNEPQQPPVESVKRKAEDKKEPELISPPPVRREIREVSVSGPQRSPVESVKQEVGDRQEKKVAIEPHRNLAPITDFPIKPQMSMKSPSAPEDEIIFAQPRYAENPKPLYPKEARKKGYEGEVVLRVEVLASGKVGQVEVKHSSGYEMLDRSALTTVKQWIFIPGKKGDNPVRLWVNIPIKFQLQ